MRDIEAGACVVGMEAIQERRDVKRAGRLKLHQYANLYSRNAR